MDKQTELVDKLIQMAIIKNKRVEEEGLTRDFN